MAVTTTPRIILDGAYAKSNANKPSTMATESSELLRVVTRAIRSLYTIAARVNPYFFAKYEIVAYDASAGVDGWPRPEAAESVFSIQANPTTDGGAIPAGTEITVVPQGDLIALASGMYALYSLGKVFRPFAGALGPINGSITIYYSRVADAPATLNTALDYQWVEQFDELLKLEVAVHLAIKDRRTQEIADLKEERNRWAQMFIMFLEHEHINEQSRFAAEPGYNWQQLSAMLAGGA